MDGGRKTHSKATLGGLSGLFGVWLTSTALAAPPAGRGMMQSMSGSEANAERTNTFRAVNLFRAANSFRAESQIPGTSNSKLDSVARLDLRAPTNLPAAGATEERSAAMADARTTPFPSERQGEYGVRARLQQDLPTLGSEGAGARIPSRAQQLAQRFRREGLPIARLFESRSALVSLGLNQRGKPGLWLIQKIP